jgi:hypothetical protein
MLNKRQRRSAGLGSGRVAVALSAAALVVALLGVIPVSSAGSSAVELAKGTINGSPAANQKLIRGPRGPRGKTGARGPQGIPGAQGERGPQGVQGPQGDRGPQGERGERGERGAAGTGIAARVRSAGEATTSDQFQSTAWPLTGNIWTQRSGEIDLLFGAIEVRNPSACEPQDQYGASAYVNVLIDGEFVGSAYAGFFEGSAGRTQRIGLSFYPNAGLMAPDSDQAHVVTARVYDTCKGVDQNFTFKSLRLDIVGAS